jgi:hypothetical protein
MTLQDMELDDEDKLDAVMPMPMSKPDFPYGMRLSLQEPQLKKLGLSDPMPEVGDYVMMTVLARVTHCSKSDGEMGQNCCVELQVEKAHAHDVEGDD